MLAAYVLRQGSRIATLIATEVWGSAVHAPGGAFDLVQPGLALDGLLQAELAQCELEMVQLIDDGGRQGGLDGPAMQRQRYAVGKVAATCALFPTQ